MVVLPPCAETTVTSDVGAPTTVVRRPPTSWPPVAFVRGGLVTVSTGLATVSLDVAVTDKSSGGCGEHRPGYGHNIGWRTGDNVALLA